MVSKTYKENLINDSNTLFLFEKPRFTINYKKSSMTPDTKIEHWGFIIDSENMTVPLTGEKVEKLTNLAHENEWMLDRAVFKMLTNDFSFMRWI